MPIQCHPTGLSAQRSSDKKYNPNKFRCLILNRFMSLYQKIKTKDKTLIETEIKVQYLTQKIFICFQFSKIYKQHCP